MKWPTKQIPLAWTEEETQLLRENEAAIARATQCDRMRLAVKRSDGSWFIAVAGGARSYRAGNFNVKGESEMMNSAEINVALHTYFQAAEKFMQFMEGDIAPMAAEYEKARLGVYKALGEVAPATTEGTPTGWGATL